MRPLLLLPLPSLCCSLCTLTQSQRAWTVWDCLPCDLCRSPWWATLPVHSCAPWPCCAEPPAASIRVWASPLGPMRSPFRTAGCLQDLWVSLAPDFHRCVVSGMSYLTNQSFCMQAWLECMTSGHTMRTRMGGAVLACRSSPQCIHQQPDKAVCIVAEGWPS